MHWNMAHLRKTHKPNLCRPNIATNCVLLHTVEIREEILHLEGRRKRGATLSMSPARWRPEAEPHSPRASLRLWSQTPLLLCSGSLLYVALSKTAHSTLLQLSHHQGNNLYVHICCIFLMKIHTKYLCHAQVNWSNRNRRDISDKICLHSANFGYLDVD